MGEVTAGIKFAPQQLAWFTANAAEVFPSGIVFYCNEAPNKGHYKFTDGVTALGALTFLGGGGGGGGGSVDSVSGTTNRISIGGTATDPIVNIAAAYDAAITAEISAAVSGLQPANGLNTILYVGQYKLNGFYGVKTNSASWNGFVRLQPYFIGNNHTISEVGTDLGVGGVGTVRFAIYADLNGDPTGDPIDESGDIDASVAGFKSYILTSPLALTTSMKVIWLGVQVSVNTVQLRNAIVPNIIGKDTSGTGSDSVLITQAYGSFPTIGAFTHNNAMPCMWVKVESIP